MDELATSRRRFVRRLAARFLVRFHMSLMFAGMLAAIGGYLVFFVFVRGWIVYVTRVGPSGPGLDLPDVSPGFGGGGGGGSGPGFTRGPRRSAWRTSCTTASRRGRSIIPRGRRCERSEGTLTCRAR